MARAKSLLVQLRQDSAKVINGIHYNPHYTQALDAADLVEGYVKRSGDKHLIQLMEDAHAEMHARNSTGAPAELTPQWQAFDNAMASAEGGILKNSGEEALLRERAVAVFENTDKYWEPRVTAAAAKPAPAPETPHVAPNTAAGEGEGLGRAATEGGQEAKGFIRGLMASRGGKIATGVAATTAAVGTGWAALHHHQKKQAAEAQDTTPPRP